MMEDYYVETELELTYLVKSIPKEVAGVSPSHLLDIYIPDTPSHAHLRLRRQDNHYEITKKTPIKDGDASAQVEQTISLSKDEFEALAIASQKRVAKDRYKMQIDGSKAELDVFTGKLAGLVLIDFEFDSLDAKASFTPPDFILADVTQEDFIAGGLLAGKSYEDIATELARFGYQRLHM